MVASCSQFTPGSRHLLRKLRATILLADTPNYHAVGSTSMLRVEMSAVVDNRFTVYGTSNFRVVNASIFPIQLCGHPMANIYAFAERAADVIKKDAAGFERRQGGGLDVLA
ncbi:GMC oxidoreductase-domain-containing protein [Aspergillus insuetus]